MSQLSLGEITIEIIRKKIKHIHLSVYPPNGRVRIAAPLRMEDDSIRLFAISKLPWIKKQQAKFQQQNRQTRREYVSGENHFFLGMRYLLKVIPSPPPFHVEIKNKKYMCLYVPPNSTREKREKVLIQWYRKQLKEQIPVLIEKWKPIIGVEVTSWGVKVMRTKWGSCNQNEKRLWFNLELARNSTLSIEYIVVHEMVHLLEKKHNERFIALMNRFMPQWKVYKEELNRFIRQYTQFYTFVQ